jgi:electron transport complex protein RnfG
MIVVLTLISGFVGSLLAFVYAATWPRIQVNERRKLEAAVYKVLPGATGFEEESVGERTIYRGTDENEAVVGIAFKAEGTGFQGIIKLMAGVTPDYGTMLGLQVLEQVETPGLGAKIVEESFRAQFRGLKLGDRIAVIKGVEASPDKGEIQAITGATISSDAVSSILSTVLAEVRETGGK